MPVFKDLVLHILIRINFYKVNVKSWCFVHSGPHGPHLYTKQVPRHSFNFPVVSGNYF